MLDGQQYPFVAEAMWRSPVPPQPGQVVDVTFNANGRIERITVVSPAQLASEQAALGSAVRKDGPAMPDLRITVTGTVALALSWWLLTAVIIEVPIFGKVEFTFWETLGLLHTNSVTGLLEHQINPSAGVYGLFAAASLAGPLIPVFWKNSRAALGGVLPLLGMAVVGVAVHYVLRNLIGNRDHPVEAIRLGLGAYVSAALCLGFALASVRTFLAARVHARQELPAARRKAA